MAEVIAEPRAELVAARAAHHHACRSTRTKIGLLIGKGGETIRGLSDEFESQIDVNDEGQVLDLLGQRRARRGARRAHPRR